MNSTKWQILFPEYLSPFLLLMFVTLFTFDYQKEGCHYWEVGHILQSPAQFLLQTMDLLLQKWKNFDRAAIATRIMVNPLLHSPPSIKILSTSTTLSLGDRGQFSPLQCRSKLHLLTIQYNQESWWKENNGGKDLSLFLLLVLLYQISSTLKADLQSEDKNLAGDCKMCPTSQL